MPAILYEDLSVRAGFVRALRLARADYVHALGSLATLVIVVYLTHLVLVLLLHGQADATARTAAFLADLVISPLILVGAAMLYFDQAARVRSRRVSSLYNEGSRSLQERFDTVRLADRIEERKVTDAIDEDDRAFIEARDMFFLATADEEGRPKCSYKGGEPGFVRVLDEHTLAFPSYDGNGMYLSTGNVLVNPAVGLLFIDFESRKRVRLNGDARIEAADCVDPPFIGAQFVVKVAVREVFPNCPRYIHKKGGVERSEFVPRAGVQAPVPKWKRMEWACDVLPPATGRSTRTSRSSSGRIRVRRCPSTSFSPR